MTVTAISTGAAGAVIETRYQRVCDRLRSDILDGTLRPGSRLKVVELAKNYGLSQMPVREAIQQLQGEGLVIVVPNRGATVRSIDRQFVSHIFDIRTALEGALARQAATVITDDQLRDVHVALIRHEREKDDDEAQMDNNTNFHQVINAVSGNVEAIKILNQYTRIIIGLKHRFGIKPKNPKVIAEVVQNHRALYAALESGDENGAQAVAEAHVRSAKVQMLNWIDCHPEL